MTTTVLISGALQSINSFNPHSHPERQAEYYPYFTDEETEV